MGGIFLFANGRRWQRVQYDQDETIVKYRERSNVTFWTVFNEGASAVPISSAAKIVLNNPADTSIGYDIYEHGKVHWFEFMQLLQSPIKVAVLYNCANGRCTGNVQNFVVQASQDSRDGSDGTWHTGTYSGGMPILYANEATNIREITFPIGNIRMLRVACQGVAWNLSDRIHTIKIYTLDDERKHRDFRGSVWSAVTNTSIANTTMIRSLFANATVGAGTTLNVLLSNIRLSATITSATSTSAPSLVTILELVASVTVTSSTSQTSGTVPAIPLDYEYAADAPPSDGTVSTDAISLRNATLSLWVDHVTQDTDGSYNTGNFIYNIKGQYSLGISVLGNDPNLWDDTNNANTHNASGITLTNGTMHHILLLYQRTAKTWRIIVDGDIGGAKDVNGTFGGSAIDTGGHLRMGFGDDVTRQYVGGGLHYARMYYRYLSDAECLSLYVENPTSDTVWL